MKDLLTTYAKHALIAGVSVGFFATILEKWSVRKSAYLYAAQPLGFLYLVIVCMLSQGRTKTPVFTKSVIKGNLIWASFVLVWWFTDRTTNSVAIPFISAFLIWLFLFILIWKKKWI